MPARHHRLNQNLREGLRGHVREQTDSPDRVGRAQNCPHRGGGGVGWSGCLSKSVPPRVRLLQRHLHPGRFGGGTRLSVQPPCERCGGGDLPTSPPHTPPAPLILRSFSMGSLCPLCSPRLPSSRPNSPTSPTHSAPTSPSSRIHHTRREGPSVVTPL